MICCVTTTPPLNLDLYTRQMAKNWQIFTDWRQPTENATLLRYIAHDSQSNTIQVTADATYQDIIGLRQRHTPTPPPFHVVTALAKVTTKDDWAVWQERDSGDWPHSIEMPGGFLRAKHVEDGVLSVDQFIIERVANDFGISSSFLTDLTFHSLFLNDSILEAMCLYSLTLTLTKNELTAKKPNHPFYFVRPDFETATHQNSSTVPLHIPSESAWKNWPSI